MKSANQSNILLITTDQQRFDTIRALGNPHIKTPNLDWLVDTGIAFTRCYSESPLCAPARSSLITGRQTVNLPAGYGDFAQPTAPEGHATLPQLLTDAGYQTRLIGKAHYYPPRGHYGWESMQILEDYYREAKKRGLQNLPAITGLGQNTMEPGISSQTEGETLTHWIVDQSINFIETRDTSRPFCLYTSFSNPHPPFDPILPYWMQYARATVPESIKGDWSSDPDANLDGFMQPTWFLNGSDNFSTDMIRDVRRAYYALITQIDYNLGLLFARLRELKLLEDTWIIFTSDHGEMLGDHNMGAKTVHLEGSAHVPLLIRPPGGAWTPSTKAAQKCSHLSGLVDIMPTILAAAGVELPEGQICEGRDLIASMPTTPDTDQKVCSWKEFHAVLHGYWKYLFCEAGGSELLFNLADDPYEQNNLLETDTHQAQLQSMRALLHTTLSQRGANAAGSNGQLLATREAPDRKTIRKGAWPGHHHPDHTDEDVMH